MAYFNSDEIKVKRYGGFVNGKEVFHKMIRIDFDTDSMGEIQNPPSLYLFKEGPLPASLPIITTTKANFIGWFTEKGAAGDEITQDSIIFDNPEHIVTLYAHYTITISIGPTDHNIRNSVDGIDIHPLTIANNVTVVRGTPGIIVKDLFFNYSQVIPKPSIIGGIHMPRGGFLGLLMPVSRDWITPEYTLPLDVWNTEIRPTYGYRVFTTIGHNMGGTTIMQHDYRDLYIRNGQLSQGFSNLNGRPIYDPNGVFKFNLSTTDQLVGTFGIPKAGITLNPVKVWPEDTFKGPRPPDILMNTTLVPKQNVYMGGNMWKEVPEHYKYEIISFSAPIGWDFTNPTGKGNPNDEIDAAFWVLL